MKIIIDDKIPYLHAAAAQLGECCYLPGAEIGPEDVATADALIIRTRTRADRALLAGSAVRFVATATIGHDHIAKDDLAELGVAWTNCPGCNATAVAQYVRSALLLASAAGHIDPRFARGEAHELCVGIVGLGHVGTAVAQALEAEGIRLLRCDPPKGEPHTLADLAREADVITLHTPLTTTGPHPTRHLADAAFFASLRRRPLFVNAARGACMDTEAVRSALRLGQISAAVIDTWEAEPHISAELLCEAFLATPHIAGYTANGKANASSMSLRALADFFGLPAPAPLLPAPPSAEERVQPAFSEEEQAALCGCSAAELRARLSARATALLAASPLLADTLRLRQDPSRFEALRGGYRLEVEVAV